MKRFAFGIAWIIMLIFYTYISTIGSKNTFESCVNFILYHWVLWFIGMMSIASRC